jgi:hypothetical protein
MGDQRLSNLKRVAICAQSIFVGLLAELFNLEPPAKAIMIPTAPFLTLVWRIIALKDDGLRGEVIVSTKA